MMIHQVLQRCLEGFGIDAIANQNLHRIQHFFEQLLEVAGGKVFIRIVGAAFPVATGIGLLFQEDIQTIDILQNRCFVNVPGFEAGSGEVGSREVSVDALGFGEVGSVEFGSF
jgi:hypothetical protein